MVDMVDASLDEDEEAEYVARREVGCKVARYLQIFARGIVVYNARYLHYLGSLGLVP